MAASRELTLLRALARAYGISASYLNVDNQLVWAPEETLAHLVNIVSGRELVDEDGVDPAGVRKTLDELRAERVERGLPPVLVAWDGELSTLRCWMKKAGAPECVFHLEEGGRINMPSGILFSRQRSFSLAGDVSQVELSVGAELPFGVHELEIAREGMTPARAVVVSAPRRIKDDGYAWGAFAPAYAIRTGEEPGIGGFRELRQVAEFIKKSGGDFLGTLPMLPSVLEGDHIDFSPYSPVSRLFWNEVFLDIENLPGGNDIYHPEQEDEELLDALREEEFVDYAKVYQYKKPFIQQAAEKFFKHGGAATPAFRHFLELYPDAEDYARFRGDEKFHLYAQYACHMQLQALKTDADEGRVAALYLDYPVGVHPGGYDAQRYAELFLEDFNVGAPPDSFQKNGQDWGFRAASPEKMVADKFSYFRRSIRHYFRYARLVRLDHIMGLYRIYCVPHGAGATQGAYLHYPFEALFAVLCLEAHHYSGALIGEDLGTVPPLVRDAMGAHGIHRMWVFPFEIRDSAKKTFDSIPEGAIATLNTHDMFPFAAFWSGKDIAQQEARKLIGPDEAKQSMSYRVRQIKSLKIDESPFSSILKITAKSAARYVMVSLEDLWAEVSPQNMPGVMDYPNWQKKFSVSFETWSADRSVTDILSAVNDNRRTKC